MATQTSTIPATPDLTKSVADLAKGGDTIESAKSAVRQWGVLSVVNGDISYDAMKLKLLKALDGVNISTVYKTAKAARNSLIKGMHAEAEKLGASILAAFLDKGYRDESQSPAKKAEQQKARDKAAAARAIKAAHVEPVNAADCYKRATELVERAGGFEAPANEEALRTALLSAIQKVKRARGTAAAKQA